MFGLFKSSLNKQEPPTIQIVLFMAASKYLKNHINQEVDKVELSDIGSKSGKDSYFDMHELYYGFLFGRIVARIEGANDQIPPPPNLLRNVDDMKNAVLSTLAPIGKDGIAKLKHPDSISLKAIAASSSMINEQDHFIKSPFKLNFSGCMVRLGVPRESADKLSDTICDDIDQVVDDVCSKALDIWDDIPQSEERVAEERFAQMLRSMVSKINSRKSYGPHFSKTDIE